MNDRKTVGKVDQTYSSDGSGKNGWEILDHRKAVRELKYSVSMKGV